MSTPNRITEPTVPAPRRLWIGLAEVRPANAGVEILGDAKGAFVNVVAWAVTREEYERRVEAAAVGAGLFVADLIGSEPVGVREARTGPLTEEIGGVISRARNNPDEVVFGTFHTFDRDNA